MSKKNDITNITVTLRFRDYDDKEHVLQFPRMGLVGVVGMAITAARELRTELEQKPLGEFLFWDGEMEEESELPEEQPELEMVLHKLRSINDNYHAAQRLMKYLQPRKERVR